MRLDVTCTWNDTLLFTGRLPAPVSLRQILPALDRDDVVVNARGELAAPDGFARDGDAIVDAGLRIEASAHREAFEGLRRPALGPAIGVAAASLALHAGALTASSLAPKPTSEQVEREHMAVMLRLLSARAEVDADESPEALDAKDNGTGARAKAEEGAMGQPRAARAVALREVSEFGMIGVLGGSAPSAPWGREVGDAFGAGGLGLSGVGTIGHGGGFGAGHGRLGGAAATRTEATASGAVRAGEWDDNADLAEFVRVLDAQSSLPLQRLDVSRRRVVAARDSAGKALASCPITFTDDAGHSVTLRTLSSGRALLFPRAEGLDGDITASLRCGGNAATVTFSAAQDTDAVVLLDGHEPREAANAQTGAPRVDLAFALDTTGSMGEEIVAVKATLARVASKLEGVRVGLVEYKDHGDPFVTRVFGMSSDVSRFSSVVASLSASGGDDFPEAVSSGLYDAIHKLQWDSQAAGRLLFLIGDAPPHAHEEGPSYADQARAASHAGIQVFTVAASGMDTFGQMVFRQIAQYTGGTEMFVLRGGAGPQSVGGGDPVASCGGTQTRYTSANLDALIVDKIRAARRAYDADPLAFDPSPKPERCSQ